MGRAASRPNSEYLAAPVAPDVKICQAATRRWPTNL